MDPQAYAPALRAGTDDVLLASCSPVRQEAFRTEAETRSALASDIVGYYVACDVQSREAVPSFRASIMDGYAVVGTRGGRRPGRPGGRSSLTASHCSGTPRPTLLPAADGPGVYPVIDAVTAGATPAFRLTSGRVVRITTGAAVPDGADAVVMVEATRLASTTEDGKEATVEILRGVRPGENIRNVGADVAMGDVVLQAGDRIGAVERGLLASLGIQQVAVHRRPVVAVMSTGDELVDADAAEPPRGSQIRDSNRPTLLQLIREADCAALDLGIVRDQYGRWLAGGRVARRAPH